MGKYDELVGRLKYCSDNTRDEYLHELAGRAAAAIATLEAELETLRPQVKVADDQWDAKCDELAAMKARGDRLAEALTNINRKASPDPERTMSEASNDLYWCACEARQALTEWRDQHHGGNDADT